MLCNCRILSYYDLLFIIATNVNGVKKKFRILEFNTFYGNEKYEKCNCHTLQIRDSKYNNYVREEEKK